MKKLLLAVPVVLCLLALSPAEPPFDLLIRGGRVVDGSGAPWFAADVGVRGGKIVAVGALSGRPATRTIDATGLYVTPGFIALLPHSQYNLLLHTPAPPNL